jgi:hypothetical protein
VNKRQARKVANRLAYMFVQLAIDTGASDEKSDYSKLTEADQKKIDDELDLICQRLFERSDQA